MNFPADVRPGARRPDDRADDLARFSALVLGSADTLAIPWRRSNGDSLRDTTCTFVTGAVTTVRQIQPLASFWLRLDWLPPSSSASASLQAARNSE